MRLFHNVDYNDDKDDNDDDDDDDDDDGDDDDDDNIGEHGEALVPHPLSSRLPPLFTQPQLTYLYLTPKYVSWW